MRHPYPADLPMFCTRQTGRHFLGGPSDYGTAIRDHDRSDESFTYVYEITECYPLTRAAAVMYLVAGGSEASAAAAMHGQPGRRPSRVFRDARDYMTLQTARNLGY